MTAFALWAPLAESVELVIDEGRLPLERVGEWWTVSADTEPEATYAFSIDGGDPRFDPRGLCLPLGPHGPSRLFDVKAHAWSDDGWAGVPLDSAVIYELHVGTFTPDGTLDSAIDRLDHLVALGITLVELLPLSSFVGRHGWGYDGVAPYAVHEPYGGPAALQRFVDAAHSRGLGVCLDVVYNHLGPDGNYIPSFAPYLTDHYVTPWGKALNLDGPYSDEVRAWVRHNVEMWFRDFHLDALRLDAVHELHDGRAVHLLEELSTATDDLAERVGRPLWLIAESDRNDPFTVTPRDRGGHGIHAQWADDVHHALHVALTGETQGYYADFANPVALGKVMQTPFFHDGTPSAFRGRHHGRPVNAELPGWRFVTALQTHDQVGNRATGDRLSATLSSGLLACGAAILLTAPWTPMLFMGEEWGASTPWQFFVDFDDPALQEAVRNGRRSEFTSHGWALEDVPDPTNPATFANSKLDWDERFRTPHVDLFAWYERLIGLRKRLPDLHDPSRDAVTVDWDARLRRFHMQRGAVSVLANLAADPWIVPSRGRVIASWQEIMETTGDSVVVPGECAVILTAHGHG